MGDYFFGAGFASEAAGTLVDSGCGWMVKGLALLVVAGGGRAIAPGVVPLAGAVGVAGATGELRGWLSFC